MVAQPEKGWVLLSYRIPREPSTPRIAVWRRLKQLGVLQIGDGLVGLPASAETQEQLEWVAEQVTEADGDAVVWRADATTRSDGERLAAQLQVERGAEYDELAAEIRSERFADGRTIARWRRELRRIEKRDHLGAPERDIVRSLLADRAGADAAEAATP